MTDGDERLSYRRVRVRVEGIVQGVGYRPFVATTATRLGLSGFVGNDPDGVFLEAEGSGEAVDELLRDLAGGPPLARVEAVRSETLPLLPRRTADGFRVVVSGTEGLRRTLVAADAATCADCLRDLWDPADRRYRYPFVNCTNCGPRLTIVRDIPYDRATTTMAGFPMCADCRAEYQDPTNRRFHAEPVCCPACGPRLRLTDATGSDLSGEAVAAAARLLGDGAIVAVKGLGGFHLAVVADDESAVARLRHRKHREDRPFALMVADVAAVRDLCDVTCAEQVLLEQPARPIVLLRRRADSGAWQVARAVAPGRAELGVMLPYTPLHHLLVAAVGGPLVLTSGNLSDEPIAFGDDDARERLAPIADAFLTHDRAIRTRVDDSVVRLAAGSPLPVRRSRGHVPQPLTLPVAATRPLLACGAELKNTFCLARGAHAFVSHHIGDLENYETLQSYLDGVDHLSRLFEIEPAVLAHDLHPEYLSTKYALERADADDRLELVGVQHHHAHIASCLADNGEPGPVLGVAFDGTGMGADGTLWGGEFLVADLSGFTRAAHLAPVALPGGASAVRQPWRMALSYLLEPSYLSEPRTLSVGRDLCDRQASRAEQVAALIRAPGTMRTSSAGRLFDAVAALAGLRDEVTYEGQAAIELEQAAASAGPMSVRDGYPASLGDGDPLVVCGSDLVVAAAEDLSAGVPVPLVAARFHAGVAEVVRGVCRRLRERTGLTVVALSGGVFQNVLLLEACTSGLAEDGFRVLSHSRVPPNDGGISLGQAAVAAARMPR